MPAKPSKPSKPIVFLSHSSKDKRALVLFKEVLERHTLGAIEFFLACDGQSIRFGDNWVASIEQALGQADLAFLFLSPNSLASTWVAFEAGFTYSKGIGVVPVALPGVELSKLNPPFSLLHGFNVHDHEQMNNFLDILGKRFSLNLQPVFTEDDFRRIFGSASALAAGFFGEYSPLIEELHFSVQTGPNPIERLKQKLDGLADLVVEPRENGQHGAAPGIEADSWNSSNQKWYFRVTIYSEVCAGLLPAVLNVLAELAQSNFSAKIGFIFGVETCGDGVKTSVRAHGTELKVLPSKRFRFRQMNVSGSAFSDIESTAPIDGKNLQDLVKVLFSSGILRFNPNKERPPRQVGPFGSNFE